VRGAIVRTDASFRSDHGSLLGEFFTPDGDRGRMSMHYRYVYMDILIVEIFV